MNATVALLEATGHLIGLGAVALVHHRRAIVTLFPVCVEVLGKRAGNPGARSVHAESAAQLHGNLVKEGVIRRRAELLFLPDSFNHGRRVL